MRYLELLLRLPGGAVAGDAAIRLSVMQSPTAVPLTELTTSASVATALQQRRS